jgi:hypothetical protein
LARLRARSCIIDGEAVACDDNGVASFELVRHHRANERIFLYAFALIELNGGDLRRDPLEVRRATLRSMLLGLRFNEHLEGDGPTVFAHACKLGPGRHCVKAQGLALSLGALASLAQDEEPGGSGGEAGSGGGLGALIAPAGTFSAASHKTSTLRSPAFASSIIVVAIISSLRSAGRLTAARAVSKAMPMRRAVSGSNVWPLKKGLMGTRAHRSS